MSNIKKDQAIVLFYRDYGESDKIVNFLSKENGKIHTIAKGAKKSKKRFLNALEPFTVLTIEFASNRNSSSLYRLESASIVNSFPSIRSNYNSYLMASLSCELANLWTREHDRCTEIFELIKWFLDSLINEKILINKIFFLKQRLLQYGGCGIEYNVCVKCGKPVDKSSKWSFIPESGGFFCEDCTKQGNMITRDIINLMRHIFISKGQKLERLKISKQQKKIIWNILKEMNCYQLEKKPLSYDMISID